MSTISAAAEWLPDSGGVSVPPSARILLIEDERESSRQAVDDLRAQSLAVVVVRGGLDAAARATTETWDLVVIDLTLPDIDGFEVLERIRAVSDVPVLILTASAADEDRILALDHGANDHMPDTASPRERLARICSILRRRSPGSGSAASA